MKLMGSLVETQSTCALFSLLEIREYDEKNDKSMVKIFSEITLTCVLLWVESFAYFKQMLLKNFSMCAALFLIL